MCVCVCVCVSVCVQYEFNKFMDPPEQAVNMSCLTEHFFQVISTHTIHIVFEGDNSSKGLPGYF